MRIAHVHVTLWSIPMSILISSRATSTADQKRRTAKRPTDSDHKVDGFAMPDLLISDPDGSVIVTVSEEGHRLSQAEPDKTKGKDNPPQSTTAFLNTRRR